MLYKQQNRLFLGNLRFENRVIINKFPVESRMPWAQIGVPQKRIPFENLLCLPLTTTKRFIQTSIVMLLFRSCLYSRIACDNFRCSNQTVSNFNGKTL